MTFVVLGKDTVVAIQLSSYDANRVCGSVDFLMPKRGHVTNQLNQILGFQWKPSIGKVPLLD